MMGPDDTLDELDLLLDEAADDDAAMLLGELDGLLAAVLVSPEPIAQEEWLPLVWGGEGMPFPHDPDDARRRRLTGLVLDRKDRIAAALLRGNMAYEPLYAIDPRDEAPLWEFWIDGFERGIGLRGDAWQALLDHEDEDLGAAVLGLQLLAQLAADPVTGRDSEFAGQAPDLIPYLVETLYRRQRGLDRIALAPMVAGIGRKPPMTAAIVQPGRNDPCPCGSGRKFKKCCGG